MSQVHWLLYLERLHKLDASWFWVTLKVFIFYDTWIVWELNLLNRMFCGGLVAGVALRVKQSRSSGRAELICWFVIRGGVSRVINTQDCGFERQADCSLVEWDSHNTCCCSEYTRSSKKIKSTCVWFNSNGIVLWKVIPTFINTCYDNLICSDFPINWYWDLLVW